MRQLLILPAILTLSGCIDTTSQAHIQARAKAEVAKRENWADQAYIRVERTPRKDYMMWRDLSWKVSAGAFDYSGFPHYSGINVVPGTERELTFSRDGCLTGYKHTIRSCTLDPAAQPESTWTPPDK